MSNKKYLIFTGIGDISFQYESWFKYKSNIYDSAAFYFGNNNNLFESLEKCQPFFLKKSKGMIFTNFVQFYDLFKNYEYILIVDSDLDIRPDEIEKTFLNASDGDWTGCQFSRAVGSYSYFQDLYETQYSGLRKTNFIEMCFMLLRKDLLKELVMHFKKINLTYSTGVDILLMNIVFRKKYKPFLILDDYQIYNPWPKDKGGVREINLLEGWEKRTKKLKLYLNRKHLYRFKLDSFHSFIYCGDKKFEFKGSGW